MPAPMPMPMPVPMPMPFAGRGPGVSGPQISYRAGAALSPQVLAAFRTALRDQSRCVRRIAARMIAREKPAWAPTEFGTLAKDADAGLREVGHAGTRRARGSADDRRDDAALSDRDAAVRAMAAWALGQLEVPEAIPALGKALDDDSVLVRRRAAWALGEIEDEAALAPLERALRDREPERATDRRVGHGRDRERQGGADAADGAGRRRLGTRRTAIWALGGIEDASAVDVLAPLVKDGDARVRAWPPGLSARSKAAGRCRCWRRPWPTATAR